MSYSTSWRPECPGRGNFDVLVLGCFDSRLAEYNAFYGELEKGLEFGLACLGRGIDLQSLDDIGRGNSDHLSISYPLQLVPFILGSCFERRGIPFTIVTGTTFDSFLDDEACAHLRQKRYSHVLFTTSFIQSFARLEHISGRLRKIFPETVLAAGGQLLNHHRKIPECPDIDFFVLGDGEEVAADLVENHAKYPSLHGKRSGIVIEAPEKDLNDYAPVDWQLFWDCIGPAERESFRREYNFPMETVRGCFYKCAFCSRSTLKGHPRLKSAERLFGEIRAMQDCGITRIGIWDSNFTTPPSRVKELCRRMIATRRGPSPAIQSYARLSDLDGEMLELLTSAGWQLLYVGIESGSDAVLDKMQKGLSRAMLLEKLELLSKYRPALTIFPSFLVGFPGEDPRSLAETWDIIKGQQFPYINIQPLDVRRGSALFREPEKYALRFEMAPRETISYNWEHATMNYQTATEAALDLVCQVALKTGSILLENLGGITSFALHFPPFDNPRNSELLRILQQIMALGILGRKGTLREREMNTRCSILWDRMESLLEKKLGIQST